MYPQFIEIDGFVVNPIQIHFIDFRVEGKAVICLGPNSLTVDGDSAVALRRFFRSPPEPESWPTPELGPVEVFEDPSGKVEWKPEMDLRDHAPVPEAPETAPNPPAEQP